MSLARDYAKLFAGLKQAYGKFTQTSELRDDGKVGGKVVTVSENFMATAIKEVAPQIIGENPMDIDRLWNKIYRMFSYMGSRGFTTSLIAGFDIALWDIKGKETEMRIIKFTMI